MLYQTLGIENTLTKSLRHNYVCMCGFQARGMAVACMNLIRYDYRPKYMAHSFRLRTFSSFLSFSLSPSSHSLFRLSRTMAVSQVLLPIALQIYCRKFRCAFLIPTNYQTLPLSASLGALYNTYLIYSPKKMPGLNRTGSFSGRHNRTQI